MARTTETQFKPDWVSPPGETILDLIEERGWTQGELASRIGFSEKHTSQLLNGKVSLTLDTAQRLARVLGGKAEFWLAREAKYRERFSRLEAAKKHAAWVGWLGQLPIKEMMATGAIPKVRNDAKNRASIVESCLRFFGVASPDDWRAHYGGMEVSFRRTRVEQTDLGAISAWLRLGEQAAEESATRKYDGTRFKKALSDIRELTCQPPEEFQPKMTELLADAGVLFVLVPAIPRARVSGVARWLGPRRPLIQLSLYGKQNDKFWFTFFHEAAHILLHGSNPEERRAVFLDDPNSTHAEDPQEKEANEWAGNWLIPEKFRSELKALRSRDAVKCFARSIGIHPGIVVGRLQHDRLIHRSWMNDLKDTYRFETRQGAERPASERCERS